MGKNYQDNNQVVETTQTKYMIIMTNWVQMKQPHLEVNIEKEVPEVYPNHRLFLLL